MLRITKKIITILLIAVLIISMAACSNDDNKTYDDYSYMLDDNGLYEGLDKYKEATPDFSTLSFTVEEILTYGKGLNESTSEQELDEYLKSYGKELLYSLGMADKDGAIEEGDMVSITLNFTVDGKQLEDYTSTNTYVATKDSDVIIGSLIGKNANDSYHVDYTFPEDDEYYPSKEAIVSVTINQVMLSDPLTDDVITKYSKELGGYVGSEINNVDNYLDAIRPRLASVLMSSYLEQYISTMDIDVPKDYTNAEVYRLKARLQKIGYKYSDYLEETQLTDKDVREYCEQVAKINYVVMLVAIQNDISVSEEELREYYSSNFEYVHETQGMPYMKLDMLRDKVLYELSYVVQLKDGDNVLNYDELFPESTTSGEAESTEPSIENSDQMQGSVETESIQPEN